MAPSGRTFLVAAAVAFGAFGALAPAHSVAAEPAPPVRAAPGWLGVSMDTGTSLDGVLVKHVVRTSPADKAGMRATDRMIKVDGAIVTNAAQVTRIVAGKGAGAEIAVVVKRADKDVELRPQLAARPSSDEILKMDHLGTFAPAWVGVAPLTGAPRSLAELRGKVVVLDFWASWCAPCRFVVPRLNAIKARFGAQGLAVVGLTTDDAEVAATAAQKLGMTYGVVVDEKGATSAAYGIGGLPTMFVIDRKGVIRHVEVGVDPASWDRVDQLIEKLVAEPAPAADKP
jgi:peroxiredoxin